MPVVAALVAAGIAFLLTVRQSPVYRASSLLSVAPNSRVEGTDEILDALESLERRTIVATLARLPPSRSTEEAAAVRLGIEPDEMRRYHVSGSVLPNTNIVRVDVYGPEPAVASRMATAVAEVTRERARDLYRIYSMRWIDRPGEAASEVRPDMRRNLALATLLGLFVGALLAVAVEVWRQSPQPRR